MAAHIRQAIREAIAARLTGLAATGANVFQSRAYAVPATALPCLLIYDSVEDSSKPVLCHPGELQRVIQVTIAGMARATADLDDLLDTIAAQVEVAMCSADFTLGGLAKEFQLVHTEKEIQGGDSDKPTGIVRMTWQVKASTREGVPGVAL